MASAGAAQPGGLAAAWTHDVGASRSGAHGFADDEALLPPARASGLPAAARVLRVPRALPVRRLEDLAPAVSRRGTVLRSSLPSCWTRRPGARGGRASPTTGLFATPRSTCSSGPRARSGSTAASASTVVDRLRPLDFEVHSLLEVTGDGGGAPQAFSAVLQRRRTGPTSAASTAYLHARAAAAAGSARAELRRGETRSGYAGERAVPRAGRRQSPPWPAPDRLLVRARCTNRDLPLFMPLTPGQTHFDVDGGPPVPAVALPRRADPAAPVAGAGEPGRAGRAVATARPLATGEPAVAQLPVAGRRAGRRRGARRCASCCGSTPQFAEPAVARQVDGLRSVAQPAGGRPHADGRADHLRPRPGDRARLRGALPSTAAARSLLGGVLEAFFRRYVALNSFTRTVVRTVERGEIMRWPARIGQRHLI